MTTTPLTDQQLRDQVAEALMSWAESNNTPGHAPFRRPETVTRNAYSRADAVLAVVRPELDRLRAELATARRQAEAAHCRLHHIEARVERIDKEDDPVGVGLDLIPWLDGPLHPDHLAAYRAAQTAGES